MVVLFLLLPGPIKLPKRPPLLFLEEHEKFYDNEGKTYEIETRGEKTHKGIYFSVRDISKHFNLPNLSSTITHKDNGYNRDIDYKCFTIKNNNEPPKKRLFITYKGLLRIIFSSRVGNTDKILNSIINNVFTAQLGNIKDRTELSASLLGVPITALKKVLKISTTTFPCVYIFSLGLAKDLRSSMNISSPFPLASQRKRRRMLSIVATSTPGKAILK